MAGLGLAGLGGGLLATSPQTRVPQHLVRPMHVTSCKLNFVRSGSGGGGPLDWKHIAPCSSTNAWQTRIYNYQLITITPTWGRWWWGDIPKGLICTRDRLTTKRDVSNCKPGKPNATSATASQASNCKPGKPPCNATVKMHDRRIEPRKFRGHDDFFCAPGPL